MKNIDRLIMTGYHSGGKSTFINKLMNSGIHECFNLCRFDIYWVDSDNFDYNMYLNCFNIYDRFLPFDMIIHSQYYSRDLLYGVCKGLKKYINNSIIVLSLFEFVENSNNEEQKRKFNDLKNILQELEYKNVIVLNNVEELNEFTDTFNDKYSFASWNGKKEYFDNAPLSPMLTDYLVQNIGYVGEMYNRYGFDLLDYFKNDIHFLRFIENWTTLTKDKDESIEDFFDRIEEYFKEYQINDWVW